MNEVKDNIIKKAAELFNQVGIRSCSIDDICRELGISKKTFYQYFETKDQLVEAMLTRHEEHVKHCAAENENNHVSAIEVLLHFLEAAEKMKDVRRVPPLLFDLKKYYPLLFEAHTSALARINKEYMTRLLERGKAEGDFRADLDANLCGTLLSEMNQQALNNINQLAQLDNFAELSVFTVDLVIRGIVSEQGLAKITDNR